jgi:NADP-dependent 3-hydroxy acid dehydrogenase YdfG
MKIAITGHTSGIGKAIADRYTAEGHTVTGFSRATGHDLTEPGMAFKIAAEASKSDVFVNNAFSFQNGFAQINLLFAIRDIWQNQKSKTIVNISSTASDGIMLDRSFYAINKAALDKASEQLSRSSACRIINIKPGYVETPMGEWATGITKLSPDDVAETCLWLVNQPAHMLVASLTVFGREESGFVAARTRKKS